MYFLSALFTYITVWQALFCPESPYFSYGKHKLEVFKATIQRIARVNAVDLDVD